MKLSTQNHLLGERYGLEATTEMLKAAGFDSIDMSLFCLSDNPNTVFLTPEYKTRAREVFEHAKSIGMSFSQAHMAFMFKWDQEGEMENRVLPCTERGMEICALMEIPHIVVHPLPGSLYQGKDEDEARQIQVNYYRSLEPFAREYGVKIAIENVGYTHSPERFIRLYDALDSDNFVGLVDVGHAALGGNVPQDFLRAVGGDRVAGLHIHDNDCKGDLHTTAGAGKLKWEEIMKALSDIDYRGEFTYEADFFVRNFPREIQPDALRLMTKMGRYLIGRFDYYQAQKNGGQAT